ncbi:MAG: ABC transporter substrate-binding protein [Pseudolabrys sp.]
MRRREFIGLVGIDVAAPHFWPFSTDAQQGERVRLIGVLLQATKNDLESEARVKAFLHGLEQLGWTEGRNLKLEYRWAGGNSDDIRKHAAELVALAPDILVAAGSATVGALQQATRTVPIVFATEYAIGARWLELLREISPSTTRVAVLRDPAVATGPGQFGAIQTAAPSCRMEVSPVNVRDASEIGRAATAFAQTPNGGLIVTGTPLAQLHRDLIISLAAKHRLPAVYFERFFVTDGGLISYGADFVDQYRRAGGYVHRILNGDKPADLPVQAPNKYELVINLKTAKALGISVPPSLLARADAVIE